VIDSFAFAIAAVDPHAWRQTPQAGSVKRSL